jgi:hypothetical protein
MVQLRNKNAEIVLDIIAISEGALLLSNGDLEAWVPKSLIDNYDNNWEEGNAKKMLIPVWKLRDAELI